MSALDTLAEIEAARESFRELNVTRFLVDPLFTGAVLMQELGMLGTIGATAALSRQCSLVEYRQHLSMIVAIAVEALDKLAEEKPRIVT